MHSLQL